MADSLRPGGIYILGFHLLPLDASEECTERWTERQGQTQVTVTLRVLATDRRRRIEQLRVSLLVRTAGEGTPPASRLPVPHVHGRPISPSAGRVPSLELCDVYDFWYEIDQPLELNDELSDTVFILRKRIDGGQRAGAPALFHSPAACLSFFGRTAIAIDQGQHRTGVRSSELRKATAAGACVNRVAAASI